MIRRSLTTVTVCMLTLAAIGTGVVVALRSWHPSSPFKETTVDRSQPALLKSLSDLAELHAAKGQYQVLVDVEKDTKYVPAILKGQRTVYAATGSVDAVVDLSAVGPGSVTVTGQNVHVSLPPVRLADPALDLRQSRVVAKERGVLDRIGSFVGDDADPTHDLLVLAEDKVGAAAAADGELRHRAELNVRQTVTALVHGLGYGDVTVDFTLASA